MWYYQVSAFYVKSHVIQLETIGVICVVAINGILIKGIIEKTV